MFGDSLVGEVIIVLLLLVFAIVILPLLLGVCIATSMGVTGGTYYLLVCGFACIIWLMLNCLWNFDEI